MEPGHHFDMGIKGLQPTILRIGSLVEDAVWKSMVVFDTDHSPDQRCWTNKTRSRGLGGAGLGGAGLGDAGLGLAIVKHIALAHGGDVTASGAASGRLFRDAEAR